MSNAKGHQDLHCLNSHIGIAMSSLRSDQQCHSNWNRNTIANYHSFHPQSKISQMSFVSQFKVVLLTSKATKQMVKALAAQTGLLVDWWVFRLWLWPSERPSSSKESSTDEGADSRKRSSGTTVHFKIPTNQYIVQNEASVASLV